MQNHYATNIKPKLTENTIGERIKKSRLSSGLRQSDFNIGKTTIWNLENEVTTTSSIKIIKSIASTLNVSIAYLLDLKINESDPDYIKLKKKRLIQGLTQRDLSELSGVSQYIISQYELNKTKNKIHLSTLYSYLETK